MQSELGQIEFHGSVPASTRELVEQLFFFNQRQAVVLDRVPEVVNRFGTPMIVEHEGRVSVQVPSRTTQCLFACAKARLCQPVGVALYARPVFDTIAIAHLAVHPAYSMKPASGDPGVGWLLIAKIKEIAMSIRGVTRVELPYRPGCYAQLH